MASPSSMCPSCGLDRPPESVKLLHLRAVMGATMSDTIVGRDTELEILRAAIDRVPDTLPNVVLHGDPGVGKTILLQAAVAHARARGMRILGGTGYESEAQLAFAGLYQLLAPVIDYLDRIEPYHREVIRRALSMDAGPAPERLAISVATLATLAAVAADGPVLIAVEDAHWIDHPTRDIMMFLLLRLDPYDIRAVFARRPLTSTERVSPGINMLEVSALASDAADELLSLLHPGLTETARQRVLTYAAGNPLALAELPDTRDGELGLDMDLLPAGAPLRTRLESVYTARILALDADVREPLLQAALDGDRLERRGHPVHATTLSAHAVRDIERLGLVTRDSTPSGIRFRHPLVRSAIVATASPDEIRRSHASLAEQYRHEPQRRVWHVAAAAIDPDETVAAEIEQTARAVAIRGGFGLAATAMQRAAALSPDVGDMVRRLQVAAELAGESGRLGLAQRLLDEAGHHLDNPAHRHRGLLTQARIMLLRDGDLLAVRRLLSRSGGSDHGVEQHLVDRSLTTRIVAAAYAQDAAEWQSVQSAVATTPASGTHARLLGDILADLPRTAHGTAARLRAAFDELPASATPEHTADLCRAAVWLDLQSEYRPRIRTLIDCDSGDGALVYAAIGYSFESHDLFLAGDWDAAETSAGTGLELCLRNGLELLAHDLRCTLGWIAAARGDIDTAREHSAAVQRWAQARGSALQAALAARNLALAALSEGDFADAYAHCIQVSPAGELAPHASYAPWIVLDLVDSAVHSGRIEEARAHVTAADHAGIADLSPRLRIHMFAARALIADDDAMATFKSALALPQIDQWPFDHARIRLAVGELHRRHHRPGDARPELRRAADIFGRIGATAWQRRAEQELRATGVTIEPRARPAASGSATAVLTPQQLEVAQLAASGMSNKDIGDRLYLSPRTVSAHLYRIFPKLGITSRSALRDALVAIEPRPHSGVRLGGVTKARS
jgi:DNA-binding CsgD family transcriptional regulator